MTDPACCGPPTLQDAPIFTCCCLGRGTVCARLTVDREWALRGEELGLTVEVDNRSTAAVRRMRVALRKTCEMRRESSGDRMLHKGETFHTHMAVQHLECVPARTAAVGGQARCAAGRGGESGSGHHANTCCRNVLWQLLVSAGPCTACPCPLTACKATRARCLPAPCTRHPAKACATCLRPLRCRHTTLRLPTTLQPSHKGAALTLAYAVELTLKMGLWSRNVHLRVSEWQWLESL